ncbi:D-2-hydroxyacid dehydrogenase [Paenibacillus xylanexedens]|uniref:Phosphoglycerate dehydrogenase-like enzyme n=1 Tax=Paenibacillus xylanexedens TaxID=528191 RepID=A0ABS4RYP8_PAEXY|nr:D-2-hydroxyacid dehydrogenase [Paenibacillus xylanexedens]MBP2247894.1 phosphoglycerate dehydrogenase-like enzyme [Paenibacillus xylanexedens]
MGKIVCFPSLSEEQQQRIQNAAPEYTLKFGKAKELDPAELKEAEIILGWSPLVTEHALKQDSLLKWVQVWSAGVDNLPFADLQQKNVQVTSANGVHAIPITEIILGMMLSHSRWLRQAMLHQQQSEWKAPAKPLPELHGKTAVIVGVGEIGTETARILKALGMHTIGVRRSGKDVPNVDQMYDMTDLHEALNQGDYVINILPLTDETKHIYDQTAFEQFRSGACFVNVGRGPSVKTEALLNALQNGQVAFAALDVFEEEPLPADHPLWGMENVLITPHIAGSTEQYADRAVDIFVKNLEAYVAGDTLPVNLVDYSHKY